VSPRSEEFMDHEATAAVQTAERFVAAVQAMLANG